MNNVLGAQRRMPARILSLLTIVSLLLSAFPVAFFVQIAEARIDDSVEKKVNICKATAQEPGASFTPGLQSVSINAITNGVGNVQSVNQFDIIPPIPDLLPDGWNWELENGEANLLTQGIWNNNCESPDTPGPVDLCPNLEGDQATVPQGYVQQGKSCVVPALEIPEQCSVEVDTFRVPANSSAGANSSAVLESGRDYFAVVSGTYVFGTKDGKNRVADAEYSLDVNQTEWVKEFAVDRPDVLDLFIDGVNPDFGAFAGDHTYGTLLTGSGTVANFAINDNPHSDNSGELLVTLYECEKEVTVEYCSFSGMVIESTADVDAKKNNGSPVDANRRQITGVENGPASYVNTSGKEPSWSPADFFSLGIGGYLVYEFTGQVAFGDGTTASDIAIYEITGGTSGQSDEKVEVFVSQNGVLFVSLGDYTGDAYVDIDPAGLDYVRYVKLLDKSQGVQGGTGDGYDVDAVVILDRRCGDVPEVSTSVVTLCKYDENQNRLAGWQLSLLGEKVGEVTVLPNGTEYTIAGAPAGDYVLKATGAYVYRPTNLLADAAFSERLPGDPGYASAPYQPWLASTYFAPNNYLGVQVNGTLPWGEVFSPSHTYYAPWQPTDLSNTGTFQITDTQYSDNRGSILVEAFTGYTGVTGETGCVTFEAVPYGEYSVEELLQQNWGNVSGLGAVVVDDKTETFVVVNRDLTEVPVATIVAEKVVCDAEMYLPNWNTGGKAPKITSTTAADWVTQSEGKCRLVPDWYFEWAPQNTANPDNDLPDNALYGAAGGAWTTFGPTDGTGKAQVQLTAAQIGNSKNLWAREVVKAGYVPFTYGPGNATNANNVSAEFYCHTDGKNYDNYDRVDGIKVDNTYHCVAFNAPVEVPVAQCELDIYSDTGTLVVETNQFAVETYSGNNRWTAEIPGATWVWGTFYVEEPKEDKTYTFGESFYVTEPTAATITVAADNSYVLFVNGDEVLDRSTYSVNYQDHTIKVVDILPYLNNNATNTVTIIVTNEALSNGTKLTNPAGVLYHVEIRGGENKCYRTTAPTPVEPDPEDPVDPEDPTDPEDPVDPEDPTDPEVPTDPEDPVDEDIEEPTFRRTSSSGGRRRLPEGEVLGVATTTAATTVAAPAQCGMLLLAYTRAGQSNDRFEVLKLQAFLFGQGYDVPLTGEFDADTDAAVRAFQMIHQAEVLTPWYEAGIVPHNRPTGWMYQLTRWKINNIVCPGSEPLPKLLP